MTAVEMPPEQMPEPYEPTHDEALRLDAALVIANRKMPYMATMLCALKPTWVTGLLPAAGGLVATDEGLNMYFDQQAARWPVDQIASILIHEASHPLALHFSRSRLIGLEFENRGAANVCQDAEIYSWVSGLKFPHEHVSAASISKALKLKKQLPEGMPWEWYYKHIPVSKVPPGGDCGGCSHGHKRPWEKGKGKSHKEVEALSKKTAQDIKDYAGRKPGSVPDSLLRMAEDMLTPVVDWRREFAILLKRFSASQIESHGWETYCLPDRRLSGVKSKLVFPSFELPIPRVCCVVDTSGSIGQEALRQGLTEVHAIIQKTKAHVDVAAWDVVLHEHHVNPSAGLIGSLPLSGGGGTDMAAAIEWMDRQKTDVLVLLTDLHTGWPSVAPKKPLIVVAIDKNSSMDSPSWMQVRRG